MSHLLSESFQKLLLTLCLSIRYTDFKGGRDQTSLIVLGCIRPAASTLTLWHNWVCRKESQVSSEWISFRDLGRAAVWVPRGGPACAAQGEGWRANASALRVTVELVCPEYCIALHCSVFCSRDVAVLLLVCLFNCFPLDLSFCCAVMVIINLIYTLW